MDASAFGVRRSAFGVWRLAFGVRRSAFGVWRLAFGVRRLSRRDQMKVARQFTVWGGTQKRSVP
jgi:hypothetical protein